MTGAAPFAVVRADASATIGTGHVRRCMALAVALRHAGFRVAFATRRDSESAVPELTQAIEQVLWLTDGDEVAQMRGRWPEGCDLLVVDHYDRGQAFETAARHFGRLIFIIDDFPNRRHDCDILLDSAPGRTEAAYRACVPSGAVLLLGPSYAPLHPVFITAREPSVSRRNATSPVRRVLVNFGGSASTDSHVSPALEALVDADFDGTVDIVLGASPHLSEPGRSAGKMTRNLLSGLGIERMSERMAEADLAIGAAGSSAWERCCLGVPSIVVVVADNQKDIAAALAASEAALVLGTVENVTAADIAATLREALTSPSLRQRLSANAAKLCDGLGASRIARVAAQTIAAA